MAATRGSFGAGYTPDEPLKDQPARARRVLVLGAPRGVCDSLVAARTAGFYVIAADASPEAGGFAAADASFPCAIDDADAVTALAQSIRADGIVATTDYAVAAAAIASERLGLPGISPAAAERATRKSRMREQWHAAGLPQPACVVAHDDHTLRAAVASLGFPVVLKPANALGGGSRGVSMAHDTDSLAAAVCTARAAAPDGAILVEQCIDARSEHSVELLLYRGEAHVLAIGDKIKTPAPYRVDLAVCYPTALDQVTAHAVGELATASARALGIAHGMVHVEIGVTPSGPQLFEAGARCGGGATAAPVVPLSTGIDEFVEACRVACGLPPTRTLATRQQGVCYRFIAPRVGRTVSPPTIAAMRERPGVVQVDVWGTDPTAGDALVRSGRDRIGALVTVGDTREAALAVSDDALALFDALACDSPSPTACRS